MFWAILNAAPWSLQKHMTVPILGTIVPNMGTNLNKTYGFGEALFSKTQRQVLGLLFGHPDKSFYAKEIVRFAGVGTGTVQRELEKLSGVGLLTVKKVGNQKHYQANHQSPIFKELRGIVLKTFGVADVLRQAIEQFGDRINVAFIYGSVAKGTDKAASDIDVLIVSESLSYAEAFSALNDAEQKLERTINITLYNPQEFKNKVSADSSFLTRVLEQSKILLIGSEDDIPQP
ncbi:MAG: nucleotidyltransferase domain-containing protein [Desulfuromonadaceae bacterium]|nr:nucleotidyltransferase domain-containing protein [Desulfuromonadaceae bacterium]